MKIRVRKVPVLTGDYRYEQLKANPSECASCGMLCRHPRELHPHAACLMFKACGNAAEVRANLAWIVDGAVTRTRERLRP